MAKPVKGDQAVDEDFLSRLRDLEAKCHRNLGIDTYDLAIHYLEKKRDSGPVMKGLKAAWTKESKEKFGYGLSEARKVSDRMEQAFMEGRNA